jgi:hypothetical protein
MEVNGRAVNGRDALIEEIYAELEGLLVKTQGSSDEDRQLDSLAV